MNQSLRQGAFCLSFSRAKVLRDANMQISGTIFHQSVQILAYDDDMDIVGRTFDDRTAFQK